MPEGGTLAALDALAADNIWGVGTRTLPGGLLQTFTAHYTVDCSTPNPTSTAPPQSTPTASATTPAESTVTPMATVPATAAPSETSTPLASTTVTAEPTATTCAINFSDVPPGSTFYEYVRCLACRGIVQGYDDGTYRPYSSVTRGQAAKIIAGAAGFNDPVPPEQQTFMDVAPGSTFWLYVERIAMHDAIQGYPCGEPGEPCPGVYFRPQNTLTRGQASKIVSITAGFNDPIPPDQQTFSDVPPGSTFWLYIERLYLRGIISGYPDGTFGPYNEVTRGQIAKIAANTFLPDCQTPGLSR